MPVKPVRKKKVAKPRVPRTHAGNTWTKSAYFGFIRSALRRAWTRYPVRYQVLAAAKRKVIGKRHKMEFQCTECKDWYKQKEVEVDHIDPCGSLKEYSDFPKFVSTLFCEADNLRVVCKPCHLVITKGQKDAKASVTTK